MYSPFTQILLGSKSRCDGSRGWERPHPVHLDSLTPVLGCPADAGELEAPTRGALGPFCRPFTDLCGDEGKRLSLRRADGAAGGRRGVWLCPPRWDGVPWSIMRGGEDESCMIESSYYVNFSRERVSIEDDTHTRSCGCRNAHRGPASPPLESFRTMLQPEYRSHLLHEQKELATTADFGTSTGRLEMRTGLVHYER